MVSNNLTENLRIVWGYRMILTRASGSKVEGFNELIY